MIFIGVLESVILRDIGIKVLNISSNSCVFYEERGSDILNGRKTTNTQRNKDIMQIYQLAVEEFTKKIEFSAFRVRRE